MTTLAPPAPPAASTLDLLVDLTAEVPCGWGSCPHPAAWTVRPECRHQVIACTGHRDLVDAWCAHPRRVWRCTRCRTRIPGPVEWEPL